MNDPTPRPKETPATLFGALLMGVGALMAVLCGLCSTVALLAGLGMLFGPGGISHSANAIGAAGGYLLMVVTMGGVPIAVGLLFLWVGRNLRRGFKSGRDPDRRK